MTQKICISLTLHLGVTCNACAESPIIGTRWKCAQCAIFDLCSSCHNLGPNRHQHRHPFWRIEIGSHLTSIIDNNFAHTKHPFSNCDGCNRNPIIGIRGRCEQCADYDLCSDCYHAGMHQIAGHPFRCISNLSQYACDAERIRHLGVTCDRCRKSPIIGTRWKCAQCDDFNLCPSCYDLGLTEHRHPLRFWRIQAREHLPLIITNNTRTGHDAMCDVCDRCPILGIRWRCEHCFDFDLCSDCYHAGKHNSSGHRFRCITAITTATAETNDNNNNINNNINNNNNFSNINNSENGPSRSLEVMMRSLATTTVDDNVINDPVFGEQSRFPQPSAPPLPTSYKLHIFPEGGNQNTDLTSPEATKQLVRTLITKEKMKIEINNIRNVKNNGIIIECRTSNEVKKLRKKIETKTKLKSKIPKKIFKVFSLFVNNKDFSTKNEILEEIFRLNINRAIPEKDKEKIEIVDIIKIKNGNKIAFVSVPPKTYRKLVANNYRWWFDGDVQQLREVNPLTQCRRCCRFQHKERKCEFKIENDPAFRCVRCGDNHQHSDKEQCRQPLKCVNCNDRNRVAEERNWRNYTKLQTDHSADCADCPILKQARDRAYEIIDYGL